MTDIISILNSNIINIKKNLQQLSAIINNNQQKFSMDHNIYNNHFNNDISKLINTIDSNIYPVSNQNIDILLNKYKSDENVNYMENKLKKLLSVYSV